MSSGVQDQWKKQNKLNQISNINEKEKQKKSDSDSEIEARTDFLWFIWIKSLEETPLANLSLFLIEKLFQAEQW